ncbi:MAG: methyltransferase domain-containing protein [Dokdonella sp.]
MSRIDSLHALSEFAPLAQHELELMSAQIIPAGAALVLHPRDATHFPILHWRNGTCARARIDGDELVGDISGDIGHLQADDESFDIVVVQHGAEMLRATDELIAEIDRVLAADGRLYWFGLNPLNPWCVMKQGRQRVARSETAADRLYFHSARRIENELGRCAIVVDKSIFFGGWWPRNGELPDRSGNGASRNNLFDGLSAAYLLSARKQRAALTPIPPARLRPRLSVAGGLAAPASGRIAA